MGAPGGDGGRQWLGVALGADDIERMRAIGVVGQQFRILGDETLTSVDAAGGNRLEDADAEAGGASAAAMAQAMTVLPTPVSVPVTSNPGIRGGRSMGGM